MKLDSWLPFGYEIGDRGRIRAVHYSSQAWQIYELDSGDHALVASNELCEKWISCDLIDQTHSDSISFGARQLRSIVSDNQFVLSPVSSSQSPQSMVDAMAFAVALRQSRERCSGVSFHDSIYLEQFSILLPTWTLSPFVEDKVVLGTWITGGVEISTDSFRRLSSLVGWMTVEDLEKIIRKADFQMQRPDLCSDESVSEEPSNLKTHTEVTATEHKDNSAYPQAKSEGKVQFILPGRSKLATFFNDHVVDIIQDPGKYGKLGIKFPSAIVLHGPPGCGKTFAVERLVEFIDWPIYSIDSGSVGSPYIHETSKKISTIFDLAINDSPSVIVIDEMEAFLSSRESGEAQGNHHVEEVGEFLKRIPEATDKRVLVVGMTNMIEMIDPAILRRGRFDHIVEVGMPNEEEVITLLRFLLGKVPSSSEIQVEPIALRLSGRPLSDSAFVTREAARIAAKSNMEYIGQEQLMLALDSLPEDRVDLGSKIGFHNP